MSSQFTSGFKISPRGKSINMCHFLLLLYPHLFSGEGKNEGNTYLFQIKAKLHLMIEEKAFADFIITGVLIFSFGGFYLYNMCMMRKLYKNILIPRLTLGFHILGICGCTHAMLETKIYDPDIGHF